MKKTLIFFLVLGYTAHSQFSPGSEDLYRFLGPQSLGGGSSLVNGFAGTNEHFNPAVSADNQRNTVDFQYTSLINMAGDPWGHSASLNLSIPTRFAVWNAGLWMLTSANPDFQAGTLAGVRLGIAKDVYDDFFLGVGLNAGAGGRPNGLFDYSVTGSLGFVHRPNIGSFWRNFRWGMAIRELGKTFESIQGYSSLPLLATPAIGASFDVLPPGTFQLNIGGDLSFPFFQNLVSTLNVQTFLRLSADWGIGLRSGWTLDVRDLLETTTRNSSLLPSVGIFLTSVATLDTENPNLSFLDPSYKKSDFRPAFSWAKIRQDTHAFSIGANLALGSIDTQPPKIQFETPGMIYFSPNADGIQDEVSIPWTITDERFILSWEIEVRNAEGKVVRTIRNKEIRPELQNFQNFLERLTYVKKGVAIPDTLRWDGRTDAGDVAPEGIYTLIVRAEDDNQNRSETEPFPVTLDTVKPKIDLPQIADSLKIFSPDGDGLKDELVLPITTSTENLWTLRVTNSAEQVVRTIKFENKQLNQITWDGKDDQGNQVPDGVYFINVESTDAGGNSNTVAINNIIVNTVPTPIDLNLSYAHFSPNGDGRRDTIEFTPSIPVRQGIARWNLIIEREGREVYRFEGTDQVPEKIVWDGRATQGQADDGHYRARLTLNYVKGNNPSAQTGLFRLDRTPPVATVNIDGAPTFSPGGEGSRSVMPFLARVARPDEEDQWTGKVIKGTPASPGPVVRTLTFGSNLPPQFSWDGTDNNGRLLPDDSYFLQIQGSDPAGNQTVVNTPVFTIDTRERKLLLSAESLAFSPNNDGVLDRLVLLPRLNIQEGIGNWTLKVSDAQRQLVRTYSGARTLPESIFWDGNTESGTRANEGLYSLSLEVQLLNGQTLRAAISQILLDVTPPTLTLNPQITLFSPDGESSKQEAIVAANSSQEQKWLGEIRLGTRVVRRFEWAGRIPENIRWNGRDDQGNIQADGAYTLVVFSRDQAGNSVEQTVPNIRIDRRPVQLFITSSHAIAPLAQDRSWEIRWGLTAQPNDGIESWKLEILDAREKRVVESFGNNGAVPAQVAWKSQPGRSIADGRYIGRFSVVYAKGNLPVVESAPVLVDTTAPILNLVTSPELFSPDDDDLNDELTIQIGVEDQSGIRDWSLVVLDPTGRPFHEWKGQGTPAPQIVWDGKGQGGELVQAASDYELVLTARDQVGLQAVSRKKFTTDILVIREGNRLRIAVPSIVFQANSPRLLADASEEAQRNVRILRRLAEVLNRFNTYRITIEGHAASLQFGTAGYEREETEVLIPLSLSRAETVRDELIRGGVDRSRMRVEGVGGRRPAVPHTDAPNRWKNRRVVFYLDR